MREEHAAGKLVVSTFPTRITIESTSFCNLRCVMCPHGIGAVDRPRHMPERMLDSLVEAAAVVNQAQLHGIGEPLASPVFWRALESDVFHADTKLTVNTNLTILNERHHYPGLPIPPSAAEMFRVRWIRYEAATTQKLEGAPPWHI